MKRILFALVAVFLLQSCAETPKEEEVKDPKAEAQAFIDDYTKTYQELYYASAKAEWALNTKIVEGDTLTSQKAEQAGQAFADFTGSEENIEQSRKFLEYEAELEDIQLRQLKAILYSAGANPAVAKDLVTEKIKAETAQTKKLFGYDFKLNGKSVSTNQLDSVLVSSSDLKTRLAAWESSKEVGVGLKKGLIHLRDLRNKTVQALGYKDYFDFQVSDYGMSTDEMLNLNHEVINEIWPLYRQLHTWARHELANKYGKPVPEMLPAHWLPNRWGQEWSSMVEVDGLNFDKALEEKGSRWIMKHGEDFYISLGYDALPKSFFEQSSLYPLPADADYKKNNHASAWHLDLNNDVRSLMSVEPNMRWWGTVLHELGHIYYYQAYSTDNVPVLLRGGANRAYHEAIGTLIGLASMQKPFLVEKGLVDSTAEVDEIKGLLKEALDYIVVMPWASGVMTDFEHQLYSEELYDTKNLNKTWWDLKAKYQGIMPPNERGEEYCDAASKTHINNDAAQYYDYALANVMLFQFHMHIANNILKQDPHATNYYDSKETGDFLLKLMAPGATVDWQQNLEESLGEGISANAILEYFEPLMSWLEKENEGRTHSLPESL
jgi:peptidyl-dipeptidase A